MPLESDAPVQPDVLDSADSSPEVDYDPNWIENEIARLESAEPDAAPAPARDAREAQEARDEQEYNEQVEREQYARTRAAKQADEQEEGAVAPAAAPADAVASNEKASEIDPNLRLAARQFEYSDEEIDAFFASNPELADRTFRHFANTLAEQNSRLLNPAASSAASPSSTVLPEKLNALLSDEALKSLADTSGQEVADLFRVLRDEVVGPTLVLRQQAEQAQQAALANEVQQTFAALEKDFADLYGTSKSVSRVQQAVRQELLQTADQLRTGAAQQGKYLSASEAITRAHAILSADHVKAQARREVVNQVAKRSKAITSRPVAGRSTPAQKSEEAAMATYERMAEEIGLL